MSSIRRFTPEGLAALVTLAIVVVTPATAAAAAGSSTPMADPPAIGIDPPRLTFKFTPTIWMPRLLGDSGFRPGRLSDTDDDQSLRDQEATFVAELRVDDRNGRRYRFSGFDFSVDDRSTARSFFTFGSVSISPGDDFKAEFEMTSVAGEIVLPWLERTSADGGSGIRFSPLFGARIIDFRNKVEEIGVAEQEATSVWVAPYAGLELEIFNAGPDLIPWVQRIRLHAVAAVGPALGGDNGSITDVRAMFQVDLTDSLAAHFGFKLIWLDAEDDDFEFDGSLQGIFLGASWRF
jgi:hypothetical protein